MKGLKKIALVTAIAAAPLAAQAELQALDDAAMGTVTGQAGVTIDLSANVSISEIAYQDQGFLVIDNLTLGGHNGTDLDDIRLTVDVAGADLSDLGAGVLGSGGFGADYLGTLGFVGSVNEFSQNLSDGDLVISLRSQSDGPVDFSLGIDSVSLAKQAGNGANIGHLRDANAESTVLVSDLTIDGYLGPIDIVVQEESNSMNINAYFNAGGELTLDFMGTSLGFELHNRRGEPVVIPANGLSFAHAQVDISVADGYFTDGGDALRVNVQDFSGDLDLTNITMGNGASIGSLYMTDLTVAANAVIYGH